MAHDAHPYEPSPFANIRNDRDIPLERRGRNDHERAPRPGHFLDPTQGRISPLEQRIRTLESQADDTWMGGPDVGLGGGTATPFDFSVISNGDGTYTDGTYNMDGTWKVAGGWIVTPAGTRLISDAELDDSDFATGTKASPLFVFIKVTPPAMSDAEIDVETTVGDIAGKDGKLLRWPIAAIGLGSNSIPTVFWYCRPIMATSYYMPESAP